MDTLRDAINGNAAAQTIIASESSFTCDDGFGSPIGCPTVFLNAVVAALGGTVASATTLLNNALAGNTASLNTVQGALGGMGFASGSFTKPLLVADFINTVIAGSGTVGLLTIRQAMAGNANARTVVNHLLDGKFTGKLVTSDPTTGMDYIQIGMGASTTAEAISILDDAIAGDPVATDKIKIALNNLILYSAATFDVTAVSYINGILGSLGGPPSSSDIDGDSIPDVSDPDMDGDGIPNASDTDDDNDGISDSAETDTDGDGTMDSADTDDDGDGTVDTTDTDDDGDGIPDASDPDMDTDGDGSPDIDDADDDGDGTPDATDTDDDGDGILDVDDPDSAISAASPTVIKPCGTKTAPLTGTFATSPCLWTRDTRALIYAQTYQGGEQVANYLEKWWNDEFLPSMKDMMAQLHSSVIDQTRQVGSMHDSISHTRTARKQQVIELEAKKRVLPNEETCVVGSHSAAAATTNVVANELTGGFKTDLKLRAGGAPGEPSENGPAADMADRWTKYCKYFLNPDANNGENSCPSPTTPGMIVDGDIDIEEFLFKDTIDLDKEENREAADALLINLINPIIYERLPDNVIDTATGREIILKREYLQSVRNIAMDVISNMIARRAGIPLPTTAGGTMPPMVTPSTPPPPVPTVPSSGGGTYDEFLAKLRQRESSNRYWIRGGSSNKYLGAYQMGHYALIDAGCIVNNAAASKGPDFYTWTGTCGGKPISSTADFLTGPDAVAAQDAAIKVAQTKMAGYMTGVGLAVYKCTTVNGIYLTPSGMQAAAHLIGQSGLKNCILNPNGPLCKDAFGTKWQEYNALGANYNSPFGPPCTGAPPPPPPLGPPSGPPPAPKPVGETIREIRERAGVNPADISDKPSYNEIMLAMTKERFFDPQYYVRMNNDIGAIKQEQTSVNAYIAIQMSDIETMQERINLLLAARASLKYNQQALPSQQEYAPVR